MNSAAREFGEFLDNALIDRALERNDEIRQVFHRLPPPAHEFGLMPTGACDICLAVFAGGTYRVPFLPLAAGAALPGPARDGARNIVDQPVRDLGQFLDRAD